MATGGVRRIYEEDDVVDEYLLNQLSKWILYRRVQTLARHLGISQAEYSKIATDNTEPEDHIFHVSTGCGISTVGSQQTTPNLRTRYSR